MTQIPVDMKNKVEKNNKKIIYLPPAYYGTKRKLYFILLHKNYDSEIQAKTKINKMYVYNKECFK